MERREADNFEKDSSIDCIELVVVDGATSVDDWRVWNALKWSPLLVCMKFGDRWIPQKKRLSQFTHLDRRVLPIHQFILKDEEVMQFF